MRRFRSLRWCSLSLCCALLVAVGCGDDDCGDDVHEDGGRSDGGGDGLRVEVGTPGGSDGLEFNPLMRGGDIPLRTFGQGGTHASLAVRVHGLGSNLAFFDVTVENAQTRAVVMTVPSTRPQLWLCDEAREVCDQIPVNVMTGGLAEPGIENRDGLRVIVSAAVRDERGRHGEGSEEGVLRWMPPPGRGDAGGGDDDAGESDLDGGAL